MWSLKILDSIIYLLHLICREYCLEENANINESPKGILLFNL